MLLQLITLLSQYEIVGFEKAWETASAALFTIYKFDRADSATNADKGWLKKAAVRLAAVVGVLTTVDAGLKEVANIGSQAKDFYEFIQKSEQWMRPRIEHKGIDSD